MFNQLQLLWGLLLSCRNAYSRYKDASKKNKEEHEERKAALQSKRKIERKISEKEAKKQKVLEESTKEIASQNDEIRKLKTK